MKKSKNNRLRDKILRIESKFLTLGEPGEIIVRRYCRLYPMKLRLKAYKAAFLILKQQILEAHKYKEKPVDVVTFIESPDYLNQKGVLYPKVLVEVIELNSGKYVEAVLTGGIGTGKRLCVDTPIPTPNGFKKMGDLIAGDVVYDSKGKPCRVTIAHPIEKSNDSYRVHFSDGVSIVADGDHNWWTQTFLERKSLKRSGLIKGEVRTTKQIAESLFYRGQLNHSIPLTAPVEGTTQRFVADPYLLGVWLGDGASSMARISTADPEILHAFSRDYSVRHIAGYDYGISGGFYDALVYYDLLNNKRIPSDWIHASKEQRLALVQGLMDSDGTVDYRTGAISFTQKCNKVTDGFVKLLWSLGAKPVVTKIEKRCGGVRGEYNHVTFSCPEGIEVFRLKRKLALCKRPTAQQSRRNNRYIKSIEKIEPTLMRCITVDSPDHLYLAGHEHIVTHNTTIALFTIAYQLYVLSCLRNPHKEFDLAPSDEIVFIFQSLNAAHAKAVDFERFLNLMKQSHYFTNVFAFNPHYKSELRFPNRIIVKPVSGSSTAAIGQNVIGGMLDEVNFMSVIEKSKKSKDGGTHNQAMENYRSIVNRRQSRFMVQGNLPGMLCLVSSKQYPGEFTDVKMQEAERKPENRIFIYDKRVWDVKPIEKFSGDWFQVFVGDEYRRPFIIYSDADKKRVKPEDESLIDTVPQEYLHSFEADILAALREIAGRSTRALNPFIINIERVANCFGKTESILSAPDCNFIDKKISIYPEEFKNLQHDRFIHIDLSVSGDSAGVACGYIDKFVPVKRGATEIEILPNVVLDFILRVEPPKNGEIIFDKIRELIYKLTALGLPIRWVSFDTYQSTDSIQLLRQKGYVTGIQSMDTSTDAYDVTKTALLDGRIKAPLHPVCYKEFISLEKNTKDQTIDHPPQGSKDCSDAVAGVTFGLTMRREIWFKHNIAISQIPESIKAKANNAKRGVDNAEGTKTVAET